MDQQQFERALEACASEPIHQIGHIQPHGGLLAFSAEMPHQIHQVSRNIAEFLGKNPDEILNQPLSGLFPPHACAQIDTLISIAHDQSTASGKIVTTISGIKTQLILHLYQSNNMLVLEMERDEGENQETRLAELLLQTQQAMLRTDSYFETGRYFDLLVQLVRSLTGYDSVMVYRFDPHWNGEIIAQSRVEAAPSYLGMHFPASDIPAQARRLYTTNLVRVVANVNDNPMPITPAMNPVTGQPLDLTYSALRSLSPIHIEYLRNIGVHASMVISLMQDDKLWGLIACHHLTPKPASMGLREAAIFISRLISTRLSGIESMEQRRLNENANLIIGDLLKGLPLSSVTEILLRLMPELQQLLNASGMVVVVEREIHVCGETPEPGKIERLLDWLAANPNSGIVSSDFLANDCPEFADVADTMAGILATPPSEDMRNCIIWLRKEKLKTVNWAGKYEEGFVQNSAGNYRLTPRKSFEIWSESWSGRCSPWTSLEVGIATMLALAIPESLAKKRLLEEAQIIQQRTETELRKHRDHLEELVRERTLALSIAKEAAEAANRAKTAFLSTVSHELRTPMNGIMGLTSLALRRTEDPKLLNYLGKVETSSEHLLAIINDMIDISELESGRLTLNLAEFQLGNTMESVKNLVMPKVSEKKLAIKFESQTDIGNCTLLGDSDRLEQILLTLVENAIKFTDVGSVSVRSYSKAEGVSQMALRIEVQDTGIGIPRASRSRIFNPFEQADNSSTRRHGGTGLGLVICKRLLKMMNGDIGFDSTEGVGSTFWIYLMLPIVSNEMANATS